MIKYIDNSLLLPEASCFLWGGSLEMDIGSAKKDRLLSLIFPVITVLYGFVLFFSGEYDKMFQHITGGVTIAAGVVTAALIAALKIDISACLKVQAIALVATFWLHLVAKWNIVPAGYGDIVDVIYMIYFLAIDLGSIVIMMFKLPGEITKGQSVIVLFSDPVFFSLVNTLMKVFANFLKDLGLLG